jgi:hypothetical protein
MELKCDIIQWQYNLHGIYKHSVGITQFNFFKTPLRKSTPLQAPLIIPCKEQDLFLLLTLPIAITLPQSVFFLFAITNDGHSG